MKAKYDVSVIVTVYNQPFDSVLKSLTSAALQEGVCAQIVIADDCSDVDNTSRYKAYFDYIGFKDYCIARCEHNLQTVGNLLNALSFCHGKYIKSLGSGDLLFERDTLACLTDLCSNHNEKASFGDYVAFSLKTQSSPRLYVAPRNRNQYDLDYDNVPINPRYLLNHQLRTADWIPGGAQFFERRTYGRLLANLHNVYGIRYCEDFAATLFLYEGKPCYSGHPAVWYEMDTGISTGTNSSSVKRMYRDHENLYKNVARLNPYGEKYISARLFFELRKLIALSPAYAVLRQKKNRQYASGSEIEFNEFYNECIRRVRTYLD